MDCSFAMGPANDLIDTQQRIQNKDVIKFDFENFPQYLENPSSSKKDFICFARTYNFHIDPYAQQKIICF